MMIGLVPAQDVDAPSDEPCPPLQGMTLKRMDNVGVVVDDLAAAIAFFKELVWAGGRGASRGTLRSECLPELRRVPDRGDFRRRGHPRGRPRVAALETLKPKLVFITKTALKRRIEPLKLPISWLV